MKLDIAQFFKYSFLIASPNTCNTFYSLLKNEQINTLPLLFDNRLLYAIQQFCRNSGHGFACSLQHFQIIKIAKMLNYPFVVIFEEDAFPINNLKYELTSLFELNDIPTDCDGISFGNLSNILFNDNTEFLKMPERGLAGAQTYLLFNKAFDKYLNIIFESKDFIPGDGIFSSIRNKKLLNFYTTSKSFFIQIKNGVVQHSKLLKDPQNLFLFNKNT